MRASASENFRHLSHQHIHMQCTCTYNVHLHTLNIHIQTYTHTHTHTHTYIHTYTHYTHTYMYTNTYTHTHTHKRSHMERCCGICSLPCYKGIQLPPLDACTPLIWPGTSSQSLCPCRDGYLPHMQRTQPQVCLGSL